MIVQRQRRAWRTTQSAFPRTNPGVKQKMQAGENPARCHLHQLETPMTAMSEVTREVYLTILQAAQTGQLAAIATTRKSDDEPVVLLAIRIDNGNDMAPEIYPVAELIHGDFHELYHTPEGARSASVTPH